MILDWMDGRDTEATIHSAFNLKYTFCLAILLYWGHKTENKRTNERTRKNRIHCWLRKCFDAHISRDTTQTHQLIEFTNMLKWKYRWWRSTPRVEPDFSWIDDDVIHIRSIFPNRYFPLKRRKVWMSDTGSNTVGQLTSIYSDWYRLNAIRNGSTTLTWMQHEFSSLIFSSQARDSQPASNTHKSSMARRSIHDGFFSFEMLNTKFAHKRNSESAQNDEMTNEWTT